MTRRILYHSEDCPEALEEAKEYIKRMGFTTETVRLIRKQGAIMVEALSEDWRK